MSLAFTECDACKAKPGSPILCAGCLANRATIQKLQECCAPDHPDQEPTTANDYLSLLSCYWADALDVEAVPDDPVFAKWETLARPLIEKLTNTVAGGSVALRTANMNLGILRRAIETHRAQKADDRCWLDDQELYHVLGDGDLGNNCVGDPAAMLANCIRFIKNRCEGGGPWKSYAELEALLEEAWDGLDHRCELYERIGTVIKDARTPK